MNKFILTVLVLSTTVASAADSSKICRDTSKRLSVLQDIDDKSCSVVIRQATSVNDAFNVYKQAGKAFAKVYRAFDQDLEEQLLKSFRELEKEERALIDVAAKKGFLLTPDKRKGEEALAFYSETSFVKKSDERELKEMRDEQKRILTAILEFMRQDGDYDIASKEFLKSHKETRLEGLENLETLRQKHQEASATLQRSIVIGEQIHCFGEDPKTGDDPLQFFDKIRQSLKITGVNLDALPSAKATEQFFSEHSLPVLQFPEGGHLMLISDEVETLVVAMMEDNLDGAELSIVIEQKKVSENIKKILSSVKQAVANAVKAFNNRGEFDEEFSDYIQNTNAAILAADAVVATTTTAFSLVGSALSGTVTGIWTGLKSSMSFTARNYKVMNVFSVARLGSDGFRSVQSHIQGIIDPEQNIADRVEEIISRIERPKASNFSSKRAYINAMKQYRSKLDDEITNTQIATKEIMENLGDTVNIGIALTEVAGVKGTAQLLSSTTTLVKNKITSAVKNAAIRKSSRKNFLNKSFSQSTLETLDDDILGGLSDLTKADQDNIKAILAKRKVKRSELDNKITNVDKPPVTTPPKIDTNFVPSNEVKPLKSVVVDGVEFADLKFGASGEAGSAKVLVKTNFEDVVALKISGTKNLEEAQALSLHQIAKEQSPNLVNQSDEVIETFLNDQLRLREESAARLVGKVDQLKIRVTKSTYVEHDGQLLKVAKKVNKEDTFEDILRKSGGELSTQDRAVFESGMKELNDQGLVWLDPNVNNSAIRQLKNPNQRVLEIFDEDGILKVSDFKMPIELSGLGEKISFDLNKAADLKRFQDKLLKGGFNRIELGQIKKAFGNELLPISAGGSPLASKEAILDIFEQADQAARDKIARKNLIDNPIDQDKNISFTKDDPLPDGDGDAKPFSFDEGPDNSLSIEDSKKALDLGNAEGVTNGSKELFDDVPDKPFKLKELSDKEKLDKAAADDHLNDLFGF